ncbi:MAG: ester cyclase, partial [Thermomicrobiales bacterium]
MSRPLVTTLTACFAFATAIGFMPGHVAAQPATPAGTESAANEDLVRRFFEIASHGDLDELSALVSPDFIIQTAPPGEGASLETLTQTFQAVRIGLPDFTMQIEDLFSQGDLVVARISISGAHRGDFFG